MGKEINNNIILIVEDDELSADILGEYLKDIGFKVMKAENGMKGFIMAKDYMPDLILLDIMMPRMDGYAFLNKMQSIPKNIPVIMTTALGKREDVAKALKLGAADYMVKPINFNILKEKLNKHLDLDLPIDDESETMKQSIDVKGNVIVADISGHITKEGSFNVKRRILDYSQTMFAGKAKVLFDLTDVKNESLNIDLLNELFEFYQSVKNISSSDVVINTSDKKIKDLLKQHHLAKYFEVVTNNDDGLKKLSS